MHFQKVTLAGVGLLGGSLGLALRQRGLADRIEGLVRRSKSIGECEGLGVVDHATRHAGRAAAGADLIVLCTPLAAMRSVLESMLPDIRPGTLITDVGSVKAPITRELEPLAARVGACYVGSHPMAGTERNGPAAARADLFVGALCVLTPTVKTASAALRRVQGLWQAVGANTLRLRPEIHDDLVGRSSHLPHIVAAELAHYVLSPVHRKEQRLLCATGFRDTTRVASGPPEIWRDIAMANRENLIRVLGVFIEGLEEVRHALETRDEAAMLDFFEQARLRRDAWVTRDGATASI